MFPSFLFISFYAPVVTLGTACVPSLPSMYVGVSGIWAIKTAYYGNYTNKNIVLFSYLTSTYGIAENKILIKPQELDWFGL